MVGVNDVLHAVSQGLLVPAEVVLLFLLAITVVFIGSVIVEALTERRHFKANIPQSVNAIHDAPFDEIEAAIERAALLRPQKNALIMVAKNMGLPDDDLFSIAKAEMSRIDDARQRSIRRTELVTKVGPMMGLICTLIPLGPGIVAMGQGQVDVLSESLLVAFDGTVSGLVAAVVAMVITTVRKRWYRQYSVAMEALMTTLLEKADEARAAGVAMPCGYSGPERAGLPDSRKRGKR